LFKRWRGLLVLFAVFLAAGAVFGMVYPHVWASDETSGEMGTLMEVVGLLNNRYYYQPVNTLDLIDSYNRQGTINGMLREAVEDPYTRYMSPQAFEQMITTTRGEYGGIGIVVGMQDGELTVISPFKGTPGDEAGLRSGDKIRAIDGRPTTYMSLDEAVGLMRGPQGEDITLTIGRNDEEFDVHIVRDIIDVVSVEEPILMENDIGYIELTTFSERTHREMQEALEQLDDMEAKGLVLDLRFNPGGTLNAAVEVTDLFVGEGALVYLEDQDGNRAPYEAQKEGTREPMPMAVLINGSSASASEIVAGALQDNDLAVLVGTQTFGKGLVQSVHQLRDGSALSLTEQAYLTSGGRNIDAKGIEPDIIVEIDEDKEEELYLGEEDVTDKQLEKALEIVAEKL